MKKIYGAIAVILVVFIYASCKKDNKPAPSIKKEVGVWTADSSAIYFYDNDKLEDGVYRTGNTPPYVYTLRADNTGDVYIGGQKAYTFNYIISDSKINYTNFALYNPDGSVEGAESPFFETIVTLTNTKLVTNLEHIDTVNNVVRRTENKIYFTRTN